MNGGRHARSSKEDKGQKRVRRRVALREPVPPDSNFTTPRPPFFPPSTPAEKELHVAWGQPFQRLVLVLIDRAIDHVCFLLLQQNHTRLDRVFDAKSSDNAWPSLPDTVTTIGALPFRCGIPPSKRKKGLISQSVQDVVHGYARTFELTGQR